MLAEMTAVNASAVMSELRGWAEEIGYLEFVASFQTEISTDTLIEFVDAELDRRLSLAVKFFFVGFRLTRSECDALFSAALFSGLLDLGLIQEDRQGGFSTGGIRLQFAHGVIFFVGVPDKRFPLYFGDDSLGLLRRQRIYSGQSALDFCTGTGVQALYLARNGANAVGVDINPLAIKLAGLNAVLNDVGSAVSFRQGDLWEAIRINEKFDWISANPPLLPALEGGNYPLVGDGGRDGMKLVWKIIERLPRHLNPRGSALVLGETWSDGILPICYERLRELSGKLDLSFRMTILRTFAIAKGDYWHEIMARTYSCHSELAYDDASQGLLSLAKEMGARAVVTYFLHIRNGRGVDVVDFSSMQAGRLWDV